MCVLRYSSSVQDITGYIREQTPGLAVQTHTVIVLPDHDNCTSNTSFSHYYLSVLISINITWRRPWFFARCLPMARTIFPASCSAKKRVSTERNNQRLWLRSGCRQSHFTTSNWPSIVSCSVAQHHHYHHHTVDRSIQWIYNLWNLFHRVMFTVGVSVWHGELALTCIYKYIYTYWLWDGDG